MKTSTIHALSLLATATLLAEPNGIWSSNSGGNNHFYEVLTTSSPISWTEARDFAAFRGGYLATITSSAENSFIFDLGLQSDPWIGGFQSAGSSTPQQGWSWITNEPFSYTNWYPGEPNDFPGGSGTEDRLQLYSDGRWNDTANQGGGITSYVVEYNFSIRPQTVYFAWGADVPVSITPKQTLFGTTRYAVNTGSMASASPDQTFRNQVRVAVQEIFNASGITNILFTDTPTSDATTVYFTDAIDARLRGKAYTGIDQFNRRSKDEVAIFLHDAPDEPFDFNLETVAETVAHELGHSLGLRHVNPGGAEIMDYYDDVGVSDRFTNSVSPITEPPTDSGFPLSKDHNPLYHLKRYVDGLSHTALAQQGVAPGEWDQGFLERVTLRLGFGADDLTLFDVYLFAGDGDADSLLTLAHFDQITLSELSDLEFELSSGSFVELLAASSLGGSLDTVLATGTPYNDANLSIPVTNGQVSALLQRHASTQEGYSTLGSATVTGSTIPEPSVVGLLLMSAAAMFCRRQRPNGT